MVGWCLPITGPLSRHAWVTFRDDSGQSLQPYIGSTANGEVRTLTDPGMPPGAFVFSAFIGNESARHEAPTAAAVVASLMRVDAWHEGSLHPKSGADFPRAEVSFHAGHGFVLQIYEDAQSLSDFLAASDRFSASRVEIELGGQALERWPAELFVSERLAVEALEWFLAHGSEKPGLHWFRIDGFPRETIWDHAESRNARG